MRSPSGSMSMTSGEAGERGDRGDRGEPGDAVGRLPRDWICSNSSFVVFTCERRQARLFSEITSFYTEISYTKNSQMPNLL